MNASMDGRTDRTDGWMQVHVNQLAARIATDTFLDVCMHATTIERSLVAFASCCVCVCLLAVVVVVSASALESRAHNEQKLTKQASRLAKMQIQKKRKTIRQSQLSLRSYSEASKRPRPARGWGAGAPRCRS